MTVRLKITCFICCAITLAAWLAAESRLAPASLTRVNGSVTLSVRPTRTVLHLFMNIRRGSDPVTGLDVELMGQKSKEFAPGRYRCDIEGFHPVAGSRVTVNINANPLIMSPPVLGGKTALTATAIINPLPAFAAPAMDARVHLASIAPLTVAWIGGNPPYGLFIFPFASREELGKPVFEQSEIARTSLTVPLATFRPRKKYGIYLSCDNADFSFSATVDPASRFKLRSSIATYIFTE